MPQKPGGQPAFYEAAEDVFIYNPESGSAPVAAYRAGDRIVADVVAANEWWDKVRVPDSLSPPEAAIGGLEGVSDGTR